MKKHLYGIDFLRGLGIFFVVILHSAFYYYGGLFSLDLNNPPAIVTVIGLLLMFAGMFAMISGLVHYYQFLSRIDRGVDPKAALKHQLLGGAFVLAAAYAYFLFTGPGLVLFDTSSFDNSFFVELIRNGRVMTLSLDRILYVDSLVMIGMNILLCGVLSFIINKIVKDRSRYSLIYFILGTIFFLLSIVRIPLYEIYLKAIENKSFGIVLLLNWLVNKNNPIFPFFAFAIMGMSIASVIIFNGIEKIRSRILPFGTIFFVVGVVFYIILPDTMLQRSIDLKWYSIMLAQLGLFAIIITGAIYYFDVKKKNDKFSFITKFIRRFGVAGFTVFFLESIVSAIIFVVIRSIVPEISFTMGQSLIFGFSLSIGWGLLLILWEKVNYKYGIEYWYTVIGKRKTGSTKGDKLRGE